jgi:potassium/chloride transporter 4/5/6
MAFLRRSPRPRDGKLGTFLGVFTPTVLTILGVILYLRLGWVVGEAGLPRALTIVVIANLITLLTTLSFSSIATNFRVGAGGAYWMISRSLGLEVGGAIGVPLFLSQAFSVTLYAYGLAESLRIAWPEVPVQAAAFVIVVLVGILAFRGAALALKIQVPLMALIALSLAALAAGVFRTPQIPGSPLPIPKAIAPEFWTIFAVFFPAVTGIMAGLGLSGDLRDPIRSIPRGAIAATIVGFAVYLAVPVLLVRAAPPGALREDPLVWARIAPLGAWLIMPGLWGAIFASAVGSVLTAPRTLQALATDRLAPSIFRKVTGGKRRDPVIALAFTIVIALAAVLLGELNAVAPLLTLVFLTVYGVVNLVAAIEALSGDPSWRPQLRIHWALSLAGALACFAVMFLISTPFAVGAIVAEAALWVWLASREREERWGDARRGVYESLIRWSLVRLAHRPMTARSWRPHVLVFVEDIERRLDLVRFGTWFSQGRGVVTVCELLVGDLAAESSQRRPRRERIVHALEREHLVAFGEVDVVRDVISGIPDVAQANGIAGLDSNTILLGWPKDPHRLVEFLHVVDRLARLNKSVVIGRIQPGLIPREGEERTIHIWWGGLQRNGDLMLLLAHLLTRNRVWRGARVQILSIASNELMKAETERNLEKLIPEIRIDAEPKVMLRPPDKAVREIIHEVSGDADIVFLGLDVPDEDKVEEYAERLVDLGEPLRTVFYVKNASLFVGELIESSDSLLRASTQAEDEKEPAEVAT